MDGQFGSSMKSETCFFYFFSLIFDASSVKSRALLIKSLIAPSNDAKNYENTGIA